MCDVPSQGEKAGGRKKSEGLPGLPMKGSGQWRHELDRQREARVPRLCLGLPKVSPAG